MFNEHPVGLDWCWYTMGLYQNSSDLLSKLLAELCELVEVLAAGLHGSEPLLVDAHEVAAALQDLGRVLLGDFEQPFLDMELMNHRYWMFF